MDIELKRIYLDIVKGGAGKGKRNICSIRNKEECMDPDNVNELKNILSVEHFKQIKSKTLSEKAKLEILETYYPDNKTVNRLVSQYFLPKGPLKNAWLSNQDIDRVNKNVFEQTYKDKYKYLGTQFCIDINKKFIFEKRRRKKGKHIQSCPFFGLVFNTARCDASGEHWVSLFVDTTTYPYSYFYYDSVGTDASLDMKNVVLKNINTGLLLAARKESKEDEINLTTNFIQHQSGNSECGVYSLYFIESMLKGIIEGEKTSAVVFKEFINSRTDKTDELIQQKRITFFRH